MERGELCELEDVIGRGLETFVEVGNALLVIRDRRLYREAGDSFDTYCRDRWQFSKAQAQRLISAAQVIGEISEADSVPMGTKTPLAASTTRILPMSERQAREVAKAPAGTRAKVWKEAVETAPRDANGTPKLTAKHVEKVVARRKQPDKPDDDPPPKAPAANPVPVDQEGHSLPTNADIRAAFAAAALLDQLMHYISRAKSLMKEIDARAVALVDRQKFEADVSNARSELSDARPYALCPYCLAAGRKDCQGCNGRGWVKQRTWKAAPEDMRDRVGAKFREVAA